MFAAVDQLVREGQLLSWGIPATGVLVETLLDRGAEGDVAEAEATIERLAAAPADDGLAIRDIWLLRTCSIGPGHGDDTAYALPGPVQRLGAIAWLRRAYSLVRGEDVRSEALPRSTIPRMCPCRDGRVGACVKS